MLVNMQYKTVTSLSNIHQLSKEDYEALLDIKKQNAHDFLTQIEEHILPHLYGDREFRRDINRVPSREIHISRKVRGEFQIFFSICIHTYWKSFEKPEDIVYNVVFSSHYDGIDSEKNTEVHITNEKPIFICAKPEIIEAHMPQIMQMFEEWFHEEATNLPDFSHIAPHSPYHWVDTTTWQYHRDFVLRAEESYFSLKHLA
jgi:hypothetical protein